MNLPTHPSRRILVIDDNRAIHEDFRKILGRPETASSALEQARASFFGAPLPVQADGSFDIDSACQGAEGLALVRRSLEEGRPYAVAFIDVRMPPGIDGIETTRQLWEIDPHLQVVICTAYSDYSWRDMVERLGQSDRLLVLKKPFDTVEVLQLAHALSAKWDLGHALGVRLADLETLVAGRTAEITAANARLQEQAALLEKAQDAIIVCGIDATVTFWNPSAERLYGWTAAEALGCRIHELLCVHEIQHQRAWAAVLEKGEWSGELLQRTRAAREVVVDAHVTLVRDEQGQPKSVLAINTDITARKQLEQQFLRAQRMESIGVLAGGIAHDLNNVLSPIMMAVEILASRYPDAASQQVLEILATSANRGAGMIRQVLQFARGVEGERMLIQPSHVVRDIRKVAGETFPKAIEMEAVAAKDLWLISADPTQIHQVLLNLSVNARDAMMPQGGTLRISAANVTLDATEASMIDGGRPGAYVCIQVSDTGVGMSPAVMARMFEPFFTTKEAGKGTGLGLSTTIGIVRNHGGFVDVRSTPGAGTTFKVYFPAAVDAAAEAETIAPVEIPRGHGELVLIVDDEPGVRAVTEETLKEFGYRVVTASDGAEACAVFAQERGAVDVVLTDLMMPVMDGAAMIRALKRMDPEVPIIAVSGHSTPEHEAVANGAGVSAFLSKPYRTQTLLHTLQESLVSHEPLATGVAASPASHSTALCSSEITAGATPCEGRRSIPSDHGSMRSARVAGSSDGR
jgi:two-component system, cell cycle sensor histidine kinase and response regulator CckA